MQPFESQGTRTPVYDRDEKIHMDRCRYGKKCFFSERLLTHEESCRKAIMASALLPSIGALDDKHQLVNFNEDQISRNTGLENMCVPISGSDAPDVQSVSQRRTRKDRQAANVWGEMAKPSEV